MTDFNDNPYTTKISPSHRTFISLGPVEILLPPVPGSTEPGTFTRAEYYHVIGMPEPE